MSRGTKNRTIRVEDELWDEARDIANGNDENLSEILRDRLREYINAGRRK